MSKLIFWRNSNFNAGINAIRRLNNAGVYDIHTNVLQYPRTMQPTRVRIEQVSPESEDATEGSSMFPPVPLKMARNFFVTDTYYENAPSGLNSSAYETSDPADFLSAFHGLGAVSDDIKDLLPESCRKAFDGALKEEQQWKSCWGLEKDKMGRRQPVIDKAIVP